MIRKAKMGDSKAIQTLVNFYADKGQMLPLSLYEVYEHLRDFFVYEEEGSIIAACALRLSWDDLAEIRSLAVSEKICSRGIGSELAKACLEEAGNLGVNKIFVLTYNPKFFEKLGFKVIDKSELPHKIWNDCLKCTKFPECDEIAMTYNFNT